MVPSLLRGVARFEGHFGPVLQAHGRSDGLLIVSVVVDDESEALNMRTDMSYTVEVVNERAVVSAPTVFGALYGLESLLQMSSQGRLPGSAITIKASMHTWLCVMLSGYNNRPIT